MKTDVHETANGLLSELGKLESLRRVYEEALKNFLDFLEKKKVPLIYLRSDSRSGRYSSGYYYVITKKKDSYLWDWHFKIQEDEIILTRGNGQKIKEICFTDWDPQAKLIYVKHK